jgi:hypothetical protein
MKKIKLKLYTNSYTTSSYVSHIQEDLIEKML